MSAKMFNKTREQGRRRLQAARPMIRDAICGFCPVQAEFVFDNCGVYFRARHGDWEIGIAGPFGLHLSHAEMHDAAVGVACSFEPGWRDDGFDPWDGYMPGREAEKRIIKSLRRWMRETALGA